MGTTTKMAIPYPEATGLVKDGWEDMKDIATQVDAKSGLVLITSATFSAVSSISFPNNTFSSNYDRYLILLESVGSTTTDIKYRMRLSGTDNTSIEYATEYLDVDSTSVAGGRNAKANSGTIGQTASSRNINEIVLFNPATTQFTMSFARSAFYGLIKFVLYSTAHEVATAYDSMTIFPASGTFTGSYSVYGYNK